MTLRAPPVSSLRGAPWLGDAPSRVPDGRRSSTLSSSPSSSLMVVDSHFSNVRSTGMADSTPSIISMCRCKRCISCWESRTSWCSSFSITRLRWPASLRRVLTAVSSATFSSCSITQRPNSKVEAWCSRCCSRIWPFSSSTLARRAGSSTRSPSSRRSSRSLMLDLSSSVWAFFLYSAPCSWWFTSESCFSRSRAAAVRTFMSLGSGGGCAGSSGKCCTLWALDVTLEPGPARRGEPLPEIGAPA
mmetsp:Transcript_68871/g.222612  ORF Transcript_68871/g.222612 Transcript_68871/m.222612 type:complete len:245 (-) Transcript_68871:68-802(-)